MSKVIEFKPKSKRDLYVVDGYHVILASSSEEALAYAQVDDNTDDLMDVVKLDDQLEVPVIHSGKVEIILWDREPREIERLSFMLKIRDFIDRDLKRFITPSRIDIIDDNAIKPKK